METQTPQIPANVGNYQNPMAAHGSSIVTLTNPDNDLYKMELTFRGMLENESGELKNVGKPLMNDEGINSVIGQVQAIVNRNTIMGNIAKMDTSMLIDFLADSLIKDLMVNRPKYQIVNDGAARDKIFMQALTTSFICLKRGYEEGDRRFWKGSQQDLRMITVNEGKSGGMLSKMNPFSKK